MKVSGLTTRRGAPGEEPAQGGHHEPNRVGGRVRSRLALLEPGELFTQEQILSG